jgi:tetratricopeptide (TPR) repeat protein
LEDALGTIARLLALSGRTAAALVVVLGALALGVAATHLFRRLRRNPESDLERQVKRLVDKSDYTGAGELRMSHNQHDKALALFLHCGNALRAAECYLALKQPRRAAQLYAEIGRWADAAHHFQAASDWKEGAECLHRLGQEREAAELYERGGEFVRAANLLRTLGDAENAARLFERGELWAEAAAALLHARGRNASALRRAGGLFERAGELRRAAECFAGAGDWFRAGELLEEGHAFSLAGQAFERAGQWGRAGAAYEQAGALHEARANFARAGDSSRAAQVAVRLGSLLDAARGFYRIGSYEQAIEILQSIAPDSPHKREAQTLLGRIFLERGLLERAKENLESAAPQSAQSKEDAEVLCLLAEAHERSGDLGRAAELLEQVLADEPNSTAAQERLDLLHKKAGGEHGLSDSLRDQRYEFQGEIGRGGMGVVYLAHDRELGRPVAIKFLPDTLATNGAAVELFRQEARAAAAMNHPNLVQVYDVGTIKGRSCIVMEYVPGRTIRDLMRRPQTKKRKPLAPAKVARIARDVARALHYAHSRNVIHRDTKPGNILISETGQIKLMDFGISKMLGSHTDGGTQGRGTPQYMPPEQILGRGLDGRTDLYALGISMFEMLTGRRPFVGENVVEQQLNSPLPDPRELKRDLPDELVEILTKACRKLPSERFTNGGEMAEALNRYLEDIGTIPPS